MSSLKIAYYKNPDYNEASDLPRFFAAIDLSSYGVAADVSGLPIFYRRLDQPIGSVRDVYCTYPMGLQVERGNLHALQAILDGYLKTIVRFERLPEYIFTIGSTAWPIYNLGYELVTRYPGGPMFSAASIEELQEALTNHFMSLGWIKSERQLVVCTLSPDDLQLYPM